LEPFSLGGRHLPILNSQYFKDYFIRGQLFEGTN
jgi:hypothetical protein